MSNTLKQSVMSGVKWLALTKIIIQAFRWGSTFWVIRQLNPNDYGVMAIAEIIINILVAINYLCIGNIIIRHKVISKAVMDTLFTFCLLIGISLFLIQFISASHFSTFYETPEAKHVLQLLAIAYLIECFNVRPLALMAKRLEFKKLAKIDLIAGILTPAATIIAALLDMGYWSLAIGYMVHTVVRLFMANYLCRSKVSLRWHYKRALKLMKFGVQNSLSGAIAQIGNSLDFIIGGILYTTSAIGVYQVGLQIAFIPLRKMAPELKRLSFPAFCKVSHDIKLVKAYYSKTIWLFSCIAFPIFWGLGLISEKIITTVVTDKWIESAIIIKILCWALPLKLLNEITLTVLNALGRSDLVLKNSIAPTAILLISIISFQFLGIQGLAIAWCISITLSYLILLSNVRKILQLSITSISKLHSQAIISSTLMYLTLLLFNEIVELNGIYYLLINAIIGAVIYSLSTFLIDRKILIEFRHILKK